MKWEYAIETVAIQYRMRVLTERGDEGWELVYHEADNGRCEMIFKRPAQPDQAGAAAVGAGLS